VSISVDFLHSLTFRELRGKRDTVVALTVHRKGFGKDIVVPITRSQVVIPTTASRVVTRVHEVIKDTGASVAAAVENIGQTIGQTIGHAVGVSDNGSKKVAEQVSSDYFVLQLVSFSKTSTDAFVADLKKFEASQSEGLIIDLRNNPGGYLDVAQEMASHFLPKDAVVVREKVGKDAVERVHASVGYGTINPKSEKPRKIVILVNKNSASASEILAGALQDYGIATLVGEQTYGKGSVQTLVDIGEEGTLKITVARWYTPNGRTISGVGLTPDIVPNVSDPKYATSSDPILDAAIEFIQTKQHSSASQSAPANVSANPTP
jgi:C-terminal processing protease CtpA/Prc